MAPGGKAIHHAYLGGLLEHTLSLVDASSRMADLHQLSVVERDALIAGAALHDYGKTLELSWRYEFDYTRRGRLIGHVAMGLMAAGDAMKMENVPPELRERVLHVIASHHGELEHGAAVLPCTREAIIFSRLDDMDAKLAAFNADASVARLDDQGFTPFNRAMNARLYVGKR